MYFKLLVALLFAFSAVADEKPTNSSVKTAVKSVELLADVASFQPGDPLRLAVKFELNPEWHIYWSYPGNFGLPTNLELKVPDGVEATEWYFPVPEKFKQIKGATGYGYSKEVVFLADVFVPEKFTKALSLEVEVKWLGCGNGQCVPGKKKLELTIPVADSANLARQDFFAEAKNKLPALQPSASSMASITSHELLPKGIKLFIEWSELPDSFQVYPWLMKGMKVENIEIKTQGLVTEYYLHFQRKMDPASFSKSKFLVSYQNNINSFAEILTLQ